MFFPGILLAGLRLEIFGLSRQFRKFAVLTWDRFCRLFAFGQLWVDLRLGFRNRNGLRPDIGGWLRLPFCFDFGFRRFICVGFFPHECCALIADFDRADFPLGHLAFDRFERVLKNIDGGGKN